MMTINLDIDLTDYFTNKYTIAKEIINIKQSINNMIMENVTVDIVKKTVDETISVVDEPVSVVDEPNVVDNDLTETYDYVVDEETNETKQVIYQYKNEYVKDKIAKSRTQNNQDIYMDKGVITNDYIKSIKMSDIKPFNFDPSVLEKKRKTRTKRSK